MIISPKRQLIWFNLVMICLGMTIVGFIIVPYIKNIHEVRADIVGTQDTLEARRAHVVQSRRSIQELSTVEQTVGKYQTMMVRVGDELQVITTLERLAGEFGIQQQLLPSFVEKKAGAKQPLYPYYEFQFVTTGSFEQLMKYLRSLELLPYYTIIDSLQFEKSKSKQSDGSQITARFTAKVYALP